MSQDHFESNSSESKPSGLSRRRFLRHVAVAAGLAAGGAQLLSSVARAEGEPVAMGGTDIQAATGAAVPSEAANSFLASLPLAEETKRDYLTPFLNSPAGTDLDPNFSTSPNFINTQQFDNYDIHLFKALDGGKDVIIAGRNGDQPGKVYYSETTIFPDFNTPAFSKLNSDIITQYGQPDDIITAADGSKQMVYVKQGHAFEYYDDPPRRGDPNSRFINKEITFDTQTASTVDDYKFGWAAKTYRVALGGK